MSRDTAISNPGKSSFLRRPDKSAERVERQCGGPKGDRSELSMQFETLNSGLRRNDWVVINRRHRSPRMQRGAAALIATVFLLLVIAVLGGIGLRLSSTDIRDTALQNDSIEALFLAESGLERAMQRLNAGTPCETLTPDAVVTLGRGDFQIKTAITVSGLCRVSVLGRVLLAGSMSAQRTVEADIEQAGASTWAVGNNGTILQWNGTAWTASPSGVTSTLNGVSCANANSCWAVGAGGTALHWDGTSWSSSSTGIFGSATLTSVACVPNSTDDCIAVGNIFGFFSVVYRYNAGTWGALEISWPNPGYTDATCTANMCYAVGPGGRAGRGFGGSWTTSEDSNTTVDLNGIDCFTDNDCWAVGPAQGNSFFYDRRTAGGWTPLLINDTNDKRDLNDVSCPSSNSCWAVGERRTGNSYNITRWNGGSSWSTNFYSRTGADELFDIDCGGINNCWAVGASGDIVRWSGASWAFVASSTGQDLNGVYVPSSGGGSPSLRRWRELLIP